MVHFFVPFLQTTEYKGEYWKDHPTIKLFWEVFHSLPLEKKKQFLCKCPFLKYIYVTFVPRAVYNFNNCVSHLLSVSHRK